MKAGTFELWCNCIQLVQPPADAVPLQLRELRLARHRLVPRAHQRVHGRRERLVVGRANRGVAARKLLEQQML
jgi:hypothetical protein